MRRRIVLAFVFLSITVPLFAQSDKNFDFRNQIKIAPLKVVGMVNPGIEMSYERFHSNRLSTQLSAAYLTDLFNLTHFEDFRGYRIGAEEKYFFKPKERVRQYISGTIEFSKTDFKDEAKFGNNIPWDYAENEEENYLDSYSVHKRMLSFNLKYGVQIPLNRFIIDIYAGLGLKYKEVRHSDRLIPEDPMELPRHPNVDYFATAEGKFTTFNIPLNVRIGYSF